MDVLASLSIALAAAAGAAGQAAGAVAAAAGAVAHLLGALGGAIASGLGVIASGLAVAGSALASGLAFLFSSLSGAAGDLGRAYASIPRTAQPYVVGGAAAGAGLSALAGLSRLGLLAPLYSRLLPSEMLDNGVRERIFQFIRDHPGAHASLISERTGAGWGTTVYHLSRLAEARMVTRERTGNQSCYFPTGFGSHEERVAHSAVKQDTARAIAEYVTRNPGASQKEVARALDLSQALVSWHVRRLADAGVLHRLREGKSTLLSPAQPPAAVPASVASA